MSEIDINEICDADRSRDGLKAINALTIEDIATFKNLLYCADECAKGVKWKDSTIHFLDNKIENCIMLKEKLLRGEYKVHDYHEFYVCERGKRRKINSLCFMDRVVNKMLNEFVLKPIYEPRYIYDNAACQRGKGTDFARDRYRQKLRKAYVDYGGNDFYVLRCDIKSYFESISHDYIKSIISKDVRDPVILKLLFDFLDKYYAKEDNGDLRGINLGSETSQTYSLIGLHYIDVFVKEELRFKLYGRYADDFYLISDDKKALADARERLAEMLEKTGLVLSKNKTFIHKAKQNVTFLGHTYRVTDTGKVLMSVARKKVAAERRKLKKLNQKVIRGEIPYEYIVTHYSSYRGSVSRGMNYYTLRNMDNLFNEIFIDDFINAPQRMEAI